MLLISFFFRTEPVRIETDATDIEAAEEKLRAALVSPFAITEDGARGRIRDGEVSVRYYSCYRHLGIRNSMRAYLFGRLVLENGRVVVVGRYSTHPLVRIFLGFWCSVVLFVFGLALFETVRALPEWSFAALAETLPRFLPFLLIPLAMLVMAYFTVRVGRFVGNLDRPDIENFFVKTLADGEA